MNNQRIFTAIAIVAVIVIGLLIYNNNHKNNVASDTNTANNANTEANTNGTDNANANANANTNEMSAGTNATITPEPTAPDGNDVQVFEIAYDGKAFTPSQLEINNGDVVVFKNNSSGSFWPASGPHPTHTNYPEFDPKKPIAAGQTWQFKFTKSGTWPFHDHLNPPAFGKIIV